MQRKYLNDLISWISDPKRKPLIIWGARQVGKSYLVEELFAKSYFKDRYLRIDCSDDRDFVDFVEKNDNLKKVLEYIELNYGFKADKDHLLIFDEAQECLPIVKMMKHFCEQRRDIPLIVTGSLVRIKIFRSAHKRGGYAKSNNFLFPVGKINQLYMFPLTFDEFLFNCNKNAYDYIKEHFEKQIPIDPTFHKQFLDLLNDFLFVGGMPEAVDTFLDYKEDRILAFNKVTERLKEIYDDYLADMDLYQASPESIIRSRLIYKDIYRQLNKENKNFKFSLTEEGAKNRDMVNPIGWLITAQVVNQSCLLKEKVTIPLIKSDESLMRLYLADMGLFTYQSGLNARTFLSKGDNVLSGIPFHLETHVRLLRIPGDVPPERVEQRDVPRARLRSFPHPLRREGPRRGRRREESHAPLFRRSRKPEAARTVLQENLVRFPKNPGAPSASFAPPRGKEIDRCLRFRRGFGGEP